MPICFFVCLFFVLFFVFFCVGHVTVVEEHFYEEKKKKKITTSRRVYRSTFLNLLDDRMNNCTCENI